jgi:hypothetical protein
MFSRSVSIFLLILCLDISFAIIDKSSDFSKAALQRQQLHSGVLTATPTETTAAPLTEITTSQLHQEQVAHDASKTPEGKQRIFSFNYLQPPRQFN